MSSNNKAAKKDSNRREFLKSSALVGGAVATSLTAENPVHAQGSDILKIGLIGCGGRGNGAAVNAMRAEDNLRLTAMAEAFPDRLEHSKNILSRQIGDKFQVDDDHSFIGFDAYKELLATDIDVVLLCTPPHFRPAMFKEAIAQNKHVFCEKPVATDAAGVRSVMDSVREAKEKDLNVVSGLCWRYDYGVREIMKKIQDGVIGEIRSIQENYLTGTLWHRGREPDWSEMEYQMRNWLYFTWLGGDHIVEQHIHSLDKAMWLMGDEPPVRATGLGGRQERTDEKWGHVFDHFSVCYEWANGVKTHSYTRQMSGCSNNVEDFVIGTKGTAHVLRNSYSINGEEKWRYKGPKPSMYDVEHKELYAAIRSGNTINNGDYMCKSTMLAIMGREVCYTGKTLTWDQMMNSKQDMTPAAYEWGDLAVPEVARPGKTPFV
jgi:myo-inositol 2-dehydrogenase/D-chiro-inositol 1-dehydrogenase